MDEEPKPVTGAVSWVDLTVPDVAPVRDFYKGVVGWTSTEVDMGGYQDYCMNSPDDGATKAGICHSRGGNADLPACWLIYITVKDLDASVASCTRLGGRIVSGPKELAPGARYCVIQDPAGAYAALYQTAE